jgi:glycosyltransferase involved in cell wall biosynthesis
MDDGKMRVAIIGSRGIPARWGGYETASEEIAIGLARLGHEVTVFCRPKYSLPERPPTYKGVKLVYLPCFRYKSLETLSHETLCMLYSLKQGYDVVYVLGTRSSFVYIPFRILRGRSRLIMNPDGLDWKRRKWGLFGRSFLRLNEWLGVRFISHHMVADSMAIHDYLEKTYGKHATFLPYGAKIRHSERPMILDQYGLQSRGYFLVVARLEPENNTDIVVRAFEKLATDKKLVIVGGTNYDSPFEKRLRSTQDSRILFTGPLYTPGHLQELLTNCYVYIHGHEVGGTNPALLDAMGSGCAVLALDVIFNREVLGYCGAFWNPDEEILHELTSKTLSMELEPWRSCARERVMQHYRWQDIVKGYDDLFRGLVFREVPLPNL